MTLGKTRLRLAWGRSKPQFMYPYYAVTAASQYFPHGVLPMMQYPQYINQEYGIFSEENYANEMTITDGSQIYDPTSTQILDNQNEGLSSNIEHQPEIINPANEHPTTVEAKQTSRIHLTKTSVNFVPRQALNDIRSDLLAAAAESE